MKTTLVISDEVVRQLKQAAARQHKTMSDLVETALRALLRGRAPKQNLPELPLFDTGGAKVDVSNRDALYDLMERG